MPVAVAPDPRSLDEVRARMREIDQRQGAAASLRARQQAVAPMVLDEEPEPEPEAVESVSDAEMIERMDRAASVMRGEVPRASIRDIIRATAFVFGFTYADLVGPSRKADIVRARRAAIHAVRSSKSHLSLPALGRAFGDRDHTTILHALRKVEAEGVPQPDGTRIPLAEATHHRLLKQQASTPAGRSGDGA